MATKSDGNGVNKPPEKPASRWAWLESKLGLLVIGAALSGILVPWFQYTQRTVEWKRQNEMDNLAFRLTMMRECLKEFTHLSTINAEAYERAQLSMQSTGSGPAALGKFDEQYIDLQNRRFHQNATVASSMIHFDDAGSVKKLFRKFVGVSSDYMRTINEMIRLHNCREGVSACDNVMEEELGGKLTALELRVDELTAELNEAYDRVIGKINQEIGRCEDESEQFRL